MSAQAITRIRNTQPLVFNQQNGETMSQWPKEGGAWGCMVNAHRQNYNGTICKNPCNWNCGFKQDFRERYCDRGDDRCFHVSAFAQRDAHLTIGANGAKWLFDDHLDAFDDQVLFLYSKYFDPNYGVVPNRNDYLLAGIYIVDSVKKDDWGRFRVIPKTMIEVSDLRVASGYYDKVPNRSYLVHFDRRNVEEMLDELDYAAQQHNRDDIRNLLPRVRAQLKRAWERNRVRLDQIEATRSVYDEQMTGSPFQALDGFKAKPRSRPAAIVEAPPLQPTLEEPAAAESQTAIVEEEHSTTPLESWDAMREVSALYQDFVAQSLWLATRGENPLVILTGPPGVGKSTIATRLAKPANTHVVSVSSNWRGREDLWGWANPADGTFRPTPFAQFVRATAEAWENDDRAPRVVVLEEFNIAPPEFWFSDFLVRSQYGSDQVAKRRVPLDGAPPDGWQDFADGVFLPPNISFVATVNQDHTTEKLSPRVLDRAATIPIEVQTAPLIEHLELTDSEHLVDAIVALDRWFRPFGAPISLRTLNAMALAKTEIEGTGMTEDSAFDLVMSTQLLPQIRLYAIEPAHVDFISRITDDWVENFGAVFPTCSSRFEAWRQQLEAGYDVEHG